MMQEGQLEAGRRVAFDEPGRHARIMPILPVKVYLTYSESRFCVRHVARRDGGGKAARALPLGLCGEKHPVGAMGRRDTGGDGCESVKPRSLVAVALGRRWPD
jgi:hypothetical protein